MREKQFKKASADTERIKYNTNGSWKKHWFAQSQEIT